MIKPRVLMFGWEFPPIVNGGLGVACLGLCKALAPLTQLQMVIPKTIPGFLMDNMELIGLNTVSLKKLQEQTYREHYQDFVNTEYIDVSLHPYMSKIEHKWASEVKDFFRENTIPTETIESDLFEIDELYGNDVIKKVLEFSRIAVRLGMTKEFDIIHAHDWMTFIPAMQLKELTGKPLVLHIHSLEYDRGGAESINWVYQLEKKAMEAADLVIPVSHYTGSVIQKHYSIKESKIFPVHNGIDTVEHSRNQKLVPEDLVIFFGRITQQKGPKFFVDAATKVLQYYKNVRFVMAGTGDLMQELMEVVAQRGIGDRFHFTGFLTKERVNELLAMADVYCMPSVSEPFGLSAVEAVQYEIPVIISKQSGAAEVLRGSLVVDYWDIDKFASYIIELLEHKNLHNEIVREANIDLRTINWESAAVKVLDGYARVLHRN